MRVIINDKRYGALKTLGERKQAFNEYLGQRKKQEAEERHIRQKKAKEEFTKMLEESEELTSSIKLVLLSIALVEIAQAYEKGGAACLSVLTDEKFFKVKISSLKSKLFALSSHG